MSEESTTADPVERWRQANEALNRRDFDGLMRFFAPQAVWDAAAAMGRFEGSAAIRRFLEDWIGSFDDYEEQFEAQYLGNGVLFAVHSLGARPAHGAGRVQERRALTSTWAAGVIVQVTAHTDIDAARAAAERLAEELG
jgi:ketosteroid isomerase-like protein